MENIIHIAMNIDSYYITQCCVVLTSIFENNRDESIHVHIINHGLPETERRDIIDIVEKRYGQVLSFHVIDTGKTRNLPFSNHITIATYYRLFVAELLPETIYKLLYLDCDIVVDGSIHDLWNTDITGYAVGCVEDMWSGKKNNYERLGYDEVYSYFNAGVMLINLDYWRRNDVGRRSLEYAYEKENNIVMFDQDILNALLHDNKLLLPFRWNVQDGFLRRHRKIRPEVLPALEEELRHPVIIHYTGSKKPWDYKSQNPYRDRYFYYLDMTRWKGARPIVPLSYRLKLILDSVLYALYLKPRKYIKIRKP